MQAWSFTAMREKSGSYRAASMTNSYYWFQLASKRKYECRFSFTTKLDTVGNSCMQNPPVGDKLLFHKDYVEIENIDFSTLIAYKEINRLIIE